MKKVTSFFALLFFAGSIFSHGGGLDKHGCHRETKTGGYHCHRSPSIDTNTPLPKEKYNQKKPNLKPTKSFKNVEDPDLLLLSLLIGKDMSTIENENKLFMKIEDSLTKLVCKGPSSSEYVLSNEYIWYICVSESNFSESPPPTRREGDSGSKNSGYFFSSCINSTSNLSYSKSEIKLVSRL